MFLSKIDLVNQLSQRNFQVKETLLSIQPFCRKKNKRVVISNVNPVIPDEIMLKATKEYGITPVSNIHDINASLAKPGRTRHILSFLSQFYIEEKDEILLPKSVTVYHENIPYWIYFSTRCELNHLIS